MTIVFTKTRDILKHDKYQWWFIWQLYFRHFPPIISHKSKSPVTVFTTSFLIVSYCFWNRCPYLTWKQHECITWKSKVWNKPCWVKAKEWVVRKQWFCLFIWTFFGFSRSVAICGSWPLSLFQSQRWLANFFFTLRYSDSPFFVDKPPSFCLL